MNIFESLGKYCKGQEENFFTEAFAFILGLDKALLTHLWSKINTNKARSFDLSGGTEVITQDSNRIRDYNKGIRLDLLLLDKQNKIIVVVECKIGNSLSRDQLEKYVSFLSEPEWQKFSKHLLAITKKPEGRLEFEGREVIYHQMRWFTVADIITKYNSPIEETYISWCKSQFLEFMEAKGMAIEQVKSDLFNGLPSLYYLLQQIQEAAKSRNLEVNRKKNATDEESRGLWILKDGALCVWCGVNFLIRDKLIFESPRFPDIDEDKVKKRFEKNAELIVSKEKIDLKVAMKTFYTCSKDGQISFLTKYFEKFEELLKDSRS